MLNFELFPIIVGSILRVLTIYSFKFSVICGTTLEIYTASNWSNLRLLLVVKDNISVEQEKSFFGYKPKAILLSLSYIASFTLEFPTSHASNLLNNYIFYL